MYIPLYTTVPAQVGFFIDFPRLLGPATLLVGTFLLLMWNWRDHYVSLIPLHVGDSWLPRTVIVAPLAVGITAAATAALLQYRSLWAYSTVLFLLARVLQGALLIYAIRKTVYYAHMVWRWLIPKLRILNGGYSRSETSSVDAAPRVQDKVIAKVRRAIVKRVAVLSGAIFAGVPLLVVYNGPHQFQYIWAVVVMLTTTVTLLIRARDIAAYLGRLPMIGLLFCIAGAEIYDFPDVPVSLVPHWIESAIVFMPLQTLFPAFSLLDAAILLASQVGLVFGIVLSVLFLSLHSRRQDSSVSER